MSERRTTGAAWAVLSAATFGTSGSFATSLLDTGWSPLAAVTVRVGLAAALLTVPALLVLRRVRVDWRREWGTQLVYGLLAVAGAQLCYFSAVQHVSVGVALLLEYSGTLLVVAWTWGLGGPAPTRTTGAGMVLALLGLVLVLEVWSGSALDLVGVLWGLGAAVGLAAYFVISARSESAIPPLASAWLGLGVGTVVLAAAGLAQLLPFTTARRSVQLAGATTSWVVPVLGLAVVAAVIAYCAGIVGARLLGPTLASFVGLSEVLFAVVLAWVLLGQHLHPVQVVGGVVVLVGIVLVRLGDPAPVEELDAPVPHPVSS